MKAEEVLAMTHRLEQSGMIRTEAEAVIRELQRVVAPLATKDDLAKLEKSIRGDMESSVDSIRADMKAIKDSMATKSDVSALEVRLFWRLSGTMLGTGAFILTLLRFFP